MPVYSMTGYASAQLSGAREPAAESRSPASQARLGVEIRSVNSRFLDLSFRLSEDLRQHEPALRELLQSRLKRGKVEVRAGVEAAGNEGLPEPGLRQLQRLAALQDMVIGWLPQARPLGVADVLRMASAEAGSGDWSQELMQLARQALKDLLGAREREGARLVEMLRGHLKQLRDLAAQARPLVPQLVEQQRNRFLERWREAMNAGQQAGGAVAPEAAQDRALTEATAFAIRIDVAEELTRLAAHLDEIERLLDKGGEVGKRLDFLIQELHREANTLGSKSAALELTRISVDMKVLVEQMREQVQNIE
ncbi:YicC/YloC family endoribonuclease [Ramlibacter rhizophilus]|uniref:YicC family protein n=1 Tax=Ramlibacter rhizophilus TaxID=1781167 RepID=A0A4Z0BRY8_9BURK|nr:YicC/YloC family endoribonuclease [Ramlibacter rhizophilus]TFZ01190.1 YicC family protein [Ramlibacter rhizophilus]